MAAGDTQITIVGNLVDDPELRFTPNGQPVATFRIASTPRWRDQQSMSGRTARASSSPATSGGRRRKTVAESLQRGMRVIVQGRLKQRSYETREGEKRTVYEIEADEVGPSLKNATAKVNKTQRQGGGGGFGGGGGGGQGGGGFGGGTGRLRRRRRRRSGRGRRLRWKRRRRRRWRWRWQPAGRRPVGHRRQCRRRRRRILRRPAVLTRTTLHIIQPTIPARAGLS